MDIPKLKFIKTIPETEYEYQCNVLSYKNIIYKLVYGWKYPWDDPFLLVDDIICNEDVITIPCKYNYNNKIYNLVGFTNKFAGKKEKAYIKLLNLINFSIDNIDINVDRNLTELRNIIAPKYININNKYIIKNSSFYTWKFLSLN